MRIDIRVQLAGFLEEIDAANLRQVPFIVRGAVNATARDVVAAVQQSIDERFVTSAAGLRFLKSRVKVLSSRTMLGRQYVPAGSDLRYGAVVGVVPPEGKGSLHGAAHYRGLLLPMMEAGGMTPGPREFGGVPGIGRFAIPIGAAARARPRQPLSMWPIQLRLQASRYSVDRGDGGSEVRGRLKGKRRTYLIPTGHGRAVIFQRYGIQRFQTRALFITRHQTRLPARRFFLPTAQRTVRTQLGKHLQQSLTHALFGRGAYRGTLPGGGA